MHIRDDSSKATVGSNRAVVWTLRAWVTIRWPSERPLRKFIGALKKSVFLLNSEPRFFSQSFLSIENLVGEVSEVSVYRNERLTVRVLPLESFAHHHDVVASAEWIWEVRDWS